MTVPDITSIPGFSEPFCSLSHLLAAGVFFGLSILLLKRGRGHTEHVFFLFIFSLSVVFLLTMSGVYHLLEPGGTPRAVLERLDHAGIFFLIAGSFTPVHGILLNGFWRWGMLALIWVITITGITLKTIFFSEIPEWLGLTLYLGLGWMGAITCVLLYRRYRFEFIKPLLYGALAYTIGAILEFARTPVLINGVIGPHEFFHIVVLFGIGYHFAFVMRAVNFTRAARAQI